MLNLGIRFGCGFLTLFGIELSNYSTWCDLGFFSLLLSEPNDEDMKKNDFFTCHLDDSLEWKTGPSSKQDKRGPPPGSLDLS